MRTRRSLAADSVKSPSEPTEKRQKTAARDQHAADPGPVGGASGGMSELEKQVQNNIEERMRMLRAFNIDELKEEVRQTAPRAKRAPAVTPRRPAVSRPHVNVQPSRRSERLLYRSGVEPDYGAQQQPPPFVQVAEDEPRKLGALTLSECMATDDDDALDRYTRFLRAVSGDLDSPKEMDSGKQEVLPEDYCRVVSGLHANAEDCWTRLVPKRVTSLSVCPLRQRRIVAAGDKTGALGVWDVDGGPEARHLLLPHRQGIVQATFPPLGDVASCYTSSYDGVTRRLDLASMTCQQVYAVPDDQLPVYLTCHAHVDAHQLLIGRSDGHVTTVDVRDWSARPSRLCLSGIRTLSVHPSRDYTLLAVEKTRTLSLWDLRRVKSSPLAHLELPQSCHGAAIDAGTGDQLVATCMDDTLRVFGGVNSGAIAPVRTVRHDNHTGRWLTPFRPVWLPGSDDRFLVGSMSRPRRLEVYQTAGRVSHMIMGEWLQSVLSTVACHPSIPMVAGANSSGRVYVF